MPGKFIVFEGLDMSGKSTQITLLRSYLENQFPNELFVFTKEPGSELNEIAPQIRGILLNTKEKLSSWTEMFLYAADRSHHVDRLKILLENNIHVVSDRYFYSSIAYQSYAGGIPLEKILSINDMAIKELVPDLYVHMNIDIETYLKNKKERLSLDRMEQKDKDYFEKAINGYNVMMNDIYNTDYKHMLPKRIVTINSSNDIKSNSNEIIRNVLQVIL